MKVSEYRSLNPDSPTMGKSTLEKRQRQAKEHSERMKGNNNPFYGKTVSNETKDRIKEGTKEAWQNRYKELTQTRRDVGQKVREANLVAKGGEHKYLGGIKGDAKHKARRRALRLHGHQCMIPNCGFDLMLDNHHIVQRCKGGTHSKYNCILLCPNHHKLADVGILTEAYLLQIVKEAVDKKEAELDIK